MKLLGSLELMAWRCRTNELINCLDIFFIDLAWSNSNLSINSQINNEGISLSQSTIASTEISGPVYEAIEILVVSMKKLYWK